MMLLIIFIQASLVFCLGVRKRSFLEIKNQQGSEIVPTPFEIDLVPEPIPELWKRESDDDDDDTADGWSFLPSRFIKVSLPDYEETDSSSEKGESSLESNNGDVSETKPNISEKDLTEINDFKENLNNIFPKLLSYVHNGAGFAAERQSSETDKILLNSLLALMTHNGNLFISEITGQLQTTNMLFELLEYRQSLTEKFVKEAVDSPEQNKVGEFRLELVDFEISLFDFIGPDATLNPKTEGLREKLWASRLRIVGLEEKFSKGVSSDPIVRSMIRKEFSRLKEVLRTLENIIFKTKALSRKPHREPRTIKDIYQGSNETLD